jgi:hypothetical protein
MRAEIGVMLLQSMVERGICSEIFVALLQHGFEHAGLDAIDACSAEDEGLPVIERLLAPFGFIRTRPALPTGSGTGSCRAPSWEQRCG